MSQHWIDEKGREVGRCTYCMRTGLVKNLRKMPRQYWDGETDLGREYCPNCYDDMLEETRKMPWNGGVTMDLSIESYKKYVRELPYTEHILGLPKSEPLSYEEWKKEMIKHNTVE